MKKIFAILLVAVLTISCFSMINIYALSDELLENGDFEDGSLLPFKSYGHASVTEVDTDYAHTGDYGVYVYDREGKWACWQQEVKTKIKKHGPGTYRASAWVKLADDETASADCQLVINYKQLNEYGDSYLTSQKVTLTHEWQEFTIEQDLIYDQEVGLHHVYVYVQVAGKSDDSFPSYYMDDFSLIKVSEDNGIDESYELTHIDVSKETRSEQTSVGVIRWDAWYGRNNVTVSKDSVLSQVEKTLSPAKYHFRAPFFAKVTKEGNIEIPEYTQAIFDQEMQYAIDAEIDYFAFLMYDDDMKTARNFYKSSQYNSQIKMCCVISPGQDRFRKEVVSLFQESYYMTVLNQRPLLYIYIDSDEQWNYVKNDIGYYRTECEKLGLQAPYVAIMSSSPKKVADVYGDAASRYGISASNGAPFSDIVSKAKTMWKVNRLAATQVIPNISFGWHTVPRYENPVKWMTVGQNSYAQYATDEELYQFTKDALDYLKDDNNKESTKANTVIVYAWNEHDEGGWVCPTIEVDKNGNQIYNDDGTPKINTGHLDALKKAIKESRSTSTVTNPEPTATATATSGTVAEPTPVVNDVNEKKPPYAIIIGGAIFVVAMGACIPVVIIKLRRKEK